MLVVGFSHGEKVKKRGPSTMCCPGSSINVSKYFIRGEEKFKSCPVPLPSAKGSVEVLLHQRCFSDGQSEIQVVSFTSRTAVGPDRNTWPL